MTRRKVRPVRDAAEGPKGSIDPVRHLDATSQRSKSEQEDQAGSAEAKKWGNCTQVHMLAQEILDEEKIGDTEEKRRQEA
jgi:hypothetical protein